MRRRFAPALLLWLTFVTLCVALIAQTRFTADLSAFLPRSPTPEQQLLVDQLRDGMVSRLILVGIEGGDAQERARVSLALGGALRADPAFGVVANGEAVHHERDQALLFEYRYLLSPTVSPERFTTHGLRGALGESLDLLASPIGMLAAPLLARDPTGEMFQLIERFDSAGAPRLHGGAWTSRDGRHALLLVQTRAAGSDLDGQQDAILRIRAAFAAALEKTEPSEPGLALLLTGPGVFAVESRATIQREVLRLALVATTLIVTLLLFIYRSPTALLLGLLPVVSGALAGIAAVSLGFGMVHGVTLGFGTTLIGEAVDYAIYRLVQAAPDAQAPAGEQVFWPTVRLGVLTSICGFAALLLSGFPGLAQLGLYSIIGLVVAAGTTRFVLPHLLPADFRVRDVSPLGERLRGAVGAATRLRWLLAALTLFAVVFLVTERDRIWNHELAALSPVPAADQALDEALRTDLGAPDVRYVVVMPGADRDAALEAAERAGERLQSLVEEGVIAGFESPARYLPSRSTQSARRASLPEPDTLTPRLAAATADLPLRPDRLSPFVADVAAARRQPLLTRESLAGTSFALAVDSLLVAQHGRWSALLPLRAPAGAGTVDAGRIRAALEGEGGPAGALFIDMKAESDRLYSGYLREAQLLALAGLASIVLLLAATLRSAARVLRILMPLAAAVVAVVAALVLAGTALTILHLVGLLLIVAVGSNYALFFDRDGGAGPTPRTLASMLFANLTTVTGFGLLAFSSVPVLKAIGSTVGPGAILALIFSAIVAGCREDEPSRRMQATTGSD